MEHDLDVVGPLRLILYASSSAVDTDFAARLSDVFLDGRAIQLQSGMLRARYRNLLGEPELLEPDRTYRLEIDMWATANRFYVLCSAETGETLAILDAGMLTAQRTGAVGALGVKYMTSPETSSVGVIGCGTQGTWQAIAACSVRPIREVYYLGRSMASIGRFRDSLAKHVPGVRATPLVTRRRS